MTKSRSVLAVYTETGGTTPKQIETFGRGLCPATMLQVDVDNEGDGYKGNEEDLG